jgi:methyl-accepting chemotaxis protein
MVTDREEYAPPAERTAAVLERLADMVNDVASSLERLAVAAEESAAALNSRAGDGRLWRRR